MRYLLLLEGWLEFTMARDFGLDTFCGGDNETGETAGRLHRFAGDERGSFVVFSLFLLITIFVVAGIAVDVVRFEAKRTRLQNTLDRAILAAADMSQSMDPEDVVESYFDKAGLSEYLADVTPGATFNTKWVTATGSGTMDTFFMKMLGIPTLMPIAAGTAEESISDIEISLVLDISNSMNQAIYEEVTYNTRYGSRTYLQNTGVTKIESLKNAAKEFVDTIYSGTATGRSSMSIVPYNSQVNVGGNLLSNYTVTTNHTLNNCVDFSSSDFETTAIDPDATLQRADHLDVWYTTMPPQLTVCDTSTENAILPLGDDAEEIKEYIEDLDADGNTSIEIGMKWGSALLDPSTQPVVSAEISAGRISGNFAGRPFNYENDDTMKVVVVMTDGHNTDQYRLNSSYKNQLSGVYRWWNGSEWRYSVAMSEGSGNSFDGDSSNNEAIRRLNVTSGSNMWASTPEGGSNAVQLTFQEVFALMSIDYHAYYFREGAYFKNPWGSHSSSSGNSNRISSTAASKGDSAYSAWNNEPYTSYDPDTKDDRLVDICDATKEQGIIVFAIGFEVEDDDADKLEACATSESHFYRVDGLEITTAFQSIANAIGKLRLTQ